MDSVDQVAGTKWDSLSSRGGASALEMQMQLTRPTDWSSLSNERGHTHTHTQCTPDLNRNDTIGLKPSEPIEPTRFYRLCRRACIQVADVGAGSKFFTLGCRVKRRHADIDTPTAAAGFPTVGAADEHEHMSSETQR